MSFEHAKGSTERAGRDFGHAGGSTENAGGDIEATFGLRAIGPDLYQ